MVLVPEVECLHSLHSLSHQPLPREFGHMHIQTLSPTHAVVHMHALTIIFLTVCTCYREVYGNIACEENG